MHAKIENKEIELKQQKFITGKKGFQGLDTIAYEGKVYRVNIILIEK